MRIARHLPILQVLLAVLLPQAFLHAGAGDSLTLRPFPQRAQQREVHNYIRPCLYLDAFGSGDQPLKPLRPAMRPINDRLKSFHYSQVNLGFYTPLYTHSSFGKKDTTDINTFHLLLTVNLLYDRPTFSGLTTQHEINKAGMGLRMIYGFGSNNVLFYDGFPYIVTDKVGDRQASQVRFSSTLLFNHMQNPKFSWRIGVTKTFLWGNRNYLPVLGIRYGRLDGPCYLSVQFPRHISVTFQPTPKFMFSVYTRAYGALYSINNTDSIYNGPDGKIQMGLSSFANGVRMDFRPGPNFSFFVSAGFSMRSHIRLYSYSFNQQNNLNPLAPFYVGFPNPSGFLNFGLAWRFGQSKKSVGNYLMYDIFDINNSQDAGDNNHGPGNGNIPVRAKKEEMKKVQYKDVGDLIEDTDLY